jgi:hypothetical protein
MKNAIAIGAIETIRDSNGQVKKLSWTFVNNMLTWKKDHAATHNTEILDCRDYKDCSNPMGSLFKDLHHKGGIDEIIISCHSDWTNLYIFSRIRSELADDYRFITPNTSWNGIEFNPGAKIVLQGCQAGGIDGKRMESSIAQYIADASGVHVLAFLCKSSQHRRKDGGYEQVPDLPGVSEFIPRSSKSMVT